MDTGNSTVWFPAAARVRAVLPHLLNGKAGFTQHSRLQIELQHLCSAITQLYNILPTGAFKTGTTDRGKEFACCTAIQEQLGLTLYFADAYSSRQRGSNENSNGLLREFYPKKTNLALVSHVDLTHSLFLINSRPRKCLAWESPIQVFLHEVAHLT